MLCSAKSRLQCLSCSSAVWGKLLGTFIFYIFILDNHLGMLIFCRSTACRKVTIVSVSLCDGVRFIGSKLFCRVAYGNWKIQRGSLIVQSQITRYVAGFVDQRGCWTWCTWRILGFSRRWSNRKKIAWNEIQACSFAIAQWLSWDSPMTCPVKFYGHRIVNQTYLGNVLKIPLLVIHTFWCTCLLLGGLNCSKMH